MHLPLRILLFLQLLHPAGRPHESAHRKGPGGLQGWTLSYHFAERDPADLLPTKLVIARKGHVIRQVEGDPFVWRWMFGAGGKQLAYETGPLHFAMQCVLVDLQSRRHLQDFDCFAEPLPPGTPEWVKALEASP